MNGKPNVVIIGAGFGGMRAATSLKDAPVDVILVDQHNYHTFQPLLYQVATAALDPQARATIVSNAVTKTINACVAEAMK